MRLLSIRLQDFLAHRDTFIRLDRPVTLVQGHHGAGKSSIRDALQYALIQRARSTDRAGKGAGQLIRSGCSEATITLEVSPGAHDNPATRHVVQRTIRAKETDLRVTVGDTAYRAAAAATRLTDLSGSLPADLVEAVLDSPGLLLMDAPRRSACLAAALDVRLTVDQLRELALAEGVGASAAESIVLGVQRFAPPQRDAAGQAERFVTAEVLGQVYERAYAKRTEVNAEVRKLRQKLEGQQRPAQPAVTEESMRRAEAGMQELETGMAALQATQEQARAAASSHASLTLLLERVRTDSATAQQLQLAPVPVAPLDPAITTRLSERQTELAAARLQLLEAQRAAGGLEAEIGRIKARSATCPSVCAPRACPFLQAELDAQPADLLDGKVNEWEAASAQVSHLQGTITDLEELVEADQLLVTQHHRLEAQAAAVNEGAKAQATRTEEEILAQLRPLEGAPERLQAATEAVEAAKGRLAEIRHGMQQTRDALAAVIRWDDAVAAARQAEQDAEVLDEAVKALAPGRLPAAAARQAAGGMLQRVNTMLDQVMGARAYQLDVTVSKAGLELVAKARRPGEPMVTLPIENLSTSEMLRIGLAMGCALSAVTGLGFVLVDQLELLVGETRTAVATELVEMAEAGQLQNVIVLESTERPTGQDDEALRCYWLEDGAAVPAGQAEVAR